MNSMQTTLFKDAPKPKVQETRNITERQIVRSEELEEPKKLNETYAHITLVRFILENVKGEIVEERINVAKSLEIMPCPQEYSHFGGFFALGTSFKKEDFGKIFTYLLDFKRQMLCLPFTEDLKDAHRFTNLKASNVLMSLSDNTKAFIESQTGKSWNDFQQEWNGINNIRPSEEYKVLVEKEHKLKKEAEACQKETNNLENALKQKLKLSGVIYGTSKLSPAYQYKSPVGLVTLLEYTRDRLTELKQEQDRVKRGIEQEYEKLTTTKQEVINHEGC